MDADQPDTEKGLCSYCKAWLFDPEVWLIKGVIILVDALCLRPKSGEVQTPLTQVSTGKPWEKLAAMKSPLVDSTMEH